MRRIAQGSPGTDGERGAVSILVAILMVTLLGFAALAVDVGMLYAERTQLRNGADAAALAIAQTCARNINDADCSTTSALPRNLANGNARDGASNIADLVLDKTARTVTVTAGAQEAGHAPNQVSLFFARVLGFSSAEVTATSRVQWGTPSKGTILLPLAIAKCKFNLQPGSLAGAEQVLDMDSGGCGEIPGGFGWISDSDASCGVTLSAGQANNPGVWFSSNTGASAPTECSAADLSQMNDQTVLLPLYDVATGNGSSGKYYVIGFAAFHVTGYHFASNSWTTGGTIKNKTIRGYFVRYVSLSDAFELGAAPAYGTSTVRLTIGVP
ncbi:pilus assembly protein TadG-related protein [Arthrobacter sp. NPDC058192]|uniref:pilus assembly protein TadG-related protein n=1 Tax=Arthrobacter sp. NPDC058192 TaxID=3346372 RepID=UPI0036E07FD5